MYMEGADDLVAFQHVRVVRSTAPALFCAIGSKRVWLPREHIKGNLWRRGDCGTLLVRRWIALDRQLTAQHPTDMPSIVVRLAVVRSKQPFRLRALDRPREVPRGH